MQRDRAKSGEGGRFEIYILRQARCQVHRDERILRVHGITTTCAGHPIAGFKIQRIFTRLDNYP